MCFEILRTDEGKSFGRKQVVVSGELCAYRPLCYGYLGFVSNANHRPELPASCQRGAAHDVRLGNRKNNLQLELQIMFANVSRIKSLQEMKVRFRRASSS